MNGGPGLSLAVAGGALLSGLLFAIDADGWPRAAVVTAFLLVGPGLVLASWLRIDDVLTGATLAVAASLGLETVVATALLAAGRWSPGVALAIVIALTLSFVAFDLATRRRDDARPILAAEGGDALSTPELTKREGTNQ